MKNKTVISVFNMKVIVFLLFVFMPALAAADKPLLSNLDVSGRIMLDYDHFDGAFNKGEKDDKVSLRRASLSFKYDLSESWEAKLQLFYSEEDKQFEEKDLHLTYKGWRFADFRFGKFKESFGLENSTSSKNIQTIERAVSTSTFSPGRGYGVGLLSQKKRHTWSLGVFDATKEVDLFDAYAVTGRATYLPVKTKSGLVHIGASGSWREGVVEPYQINEVDEIYSAKKIIESAILHTDELRQYGVEFAWQHKSWLLQSEIFRQEVSVLPNINEQDASFSGYYVQASYLLTGERHRYRKGRFVELKPSAAYGAWELVARFSSIDARSNNTGVQANNILVGINCYLNKHARLMLNYIHTEVSDVGLLADSAGNAFAARVQTVF